MAARGQNQPVCGTSSPVNVSDGTLCLWESPQPGPVGVVADFAREGSQAGAWNDTASAVASVTGQQSTSARVQSIEVTEQMIRDAMKDAPLHSQQKGGISLPRVQQFVDRLLRGEEPPAIKVDENMIVDGNHRYIAARVLGIKPPIQPWAGGRPDNAVQWENLPVDLKFW
jgi:hypothetical protein